MAKDIALDDNPEVVEVPEEEQDQIQKIGEARIPEGEITDAQVAERITQLKALAYDHVATIERLQQELRNINEAIRKLNEQLNPVEQEVQQ